MNKSADKLKKHLLALADAVNSFESEAVQVRVVLRLLNDFQYTDHSTTEEVPLSLPDDLVTEPVSNED